MLLDSAQAAADTTGWGFWTWSTGLCHRN